FDMAIGPSGVVVDKGPGPLPAAWLIGLVLGLAASLVALLLWRRRPLAPATPGGPPGYLAFHPGRSPSDAQPARSVLCAPGLHAGQLATHDRSHDVASERHASPHRSRARRAARLAPRHGQGESA